MQVLESEVPQYVHLLTISIRMLYTGQHLSTETITPVAVDMDSLI